MENFQLNNDVCIKDLRDNIKVYDVIIEGTTSLLQHRFVDYQIKKKYEEWKDFLYTYNNKVFQPSKHIESAIIKASELIKVPGMGKKTYRSIFNRSLRIDPFRLFYGIDTPQTLDTKQNKPIYLDIRRETLTKRKVLRYRPAISSGWKLKFTITCFNPDISKSVLLKVLTYAGNYCGIGDKRPEFGKFKVVKFDLVKEQNHGTQVRHKIL